MERNCITIFLSVCLSLGLFSFVSAYLPAKTPSAQPVIRVTTESISLSEVAEVPEETLLEELSRAQGPIEPESKPTSEDLKNASHYPLTVYQPLPKVPEENWPERFRPAKSILPMVEFWRNVYANYDLHNTLLHDSEDLNRVYGALDFEKLNKDAHLFPGEKQKLRSKIEAIKKGQLKEMLLRFDQGEKPVTAGEQLVFGLFAQNSDPNKFKSAAERIRGQWGQRSRFEEGLIHSGRYMPLIEQTFEYQDVPKEIANLVFVESMFILKAHSKVGAAGPWQFMPKTARLNGLVLNEYIDERYDPFIAAQAAAKLLRNDYVKIGSWPLAINAYNTGLLRMKRALNQLGTKKIATIIQNFRDGGYQFASRNFYPEFLAALEVAQNYPDYFGNLEREAPIAFEELQLTVQTSLWLLAEKTGTDIEVLKDLNLAYKDSAFQKEVWLPQGYVVRIPEGQKKIYLAALNEIKATQKVSQAYLVKRGDTLLQIANRFGVPLEELKSFNRMIGSRIRIGQIIKIPGASKTAVLEALE